MVAPTHHTDYRDATVLSVRSGTWPERFSRRKNVSPNLWRTGPLPHLAHLLDLIRGWGDRSTIWTSRPGGHDQGLHLSVTYNENSWRQVTQTQLGAQLDPPVTRASIANIETGKQRLLVHTLLQLADLLEVTLTALLPGPAVPREAEGPAIESELRRKLDLSSGATQALARRFDRRPRTRRTRADASVSQHRRQG